MILIVFLDGIQLLAKQLLTCGIDFETCHQGYQRMRILLQIGNKVTGKFIINLTVAGVLLSSCANYGTLKLRNEMPRLTYCSFPVIAVIPSAFAFLLSNLANVPKKSWKTFQTKMENCCVGI